MAEAIAEKYVFEQIDDLPTPCDSTKLFCHGSILDLLASEYKMNRLHHALLFCGPKGIGKATCAFHFAKHILSHPNQQQAPEKVSANDWQKNITAQISHNAHPQLLHLTRGWDEKLKKFKTRLAVDDIRKAQEFYKLTSGDGGYRITIIDSADDMNSNAANALLKILEEPPKHSLFIIIANRPGALLATIRSRCRHIDFSPLSDVDILSALNHLLPNIENSNYEKLAALSGGSIRRAIEIGQGEVLQHFAIFENLMQKNAKGEAENWQNIHALADTLAVQAKEQEYILFCQLIMEWLHKDLHNKVEGVPLYKLAKLAELWQTIQNYIFETDVFNLDKKQFILTLFQMFFEKNRNHA